MSAPKIVIKLTPEQNQSLQPLFDKVAKHNMTIIGQAHNEDGGIAKFYLLSTKQAAIIGKAVERAKGVK